MFKDAHLKPGIALDIPIVGRSPGAEDVWSNCAGDDASLADGVNSMRHVVIGADNTVLAYGPGLSVISTDLSDLVRESVIGVVDQVTRNNDGYDIIVIYRAQSSWQAGVGGDGWREIAPCWIVRGPM